MSLTGTSHLSDQELIQRFQQDHNNEWLGCLLERYTHLLFGLCMKYFKNETDARDGVQQIFLKVLRELPRHQVYYFKSWLYQVAKNHCLMELRHPPEKSVQTIPEPSQTIESDATALRKMQEKDRLLDQLQKAMEQLNKEQHLCIQLFYLQKKSYQEIAGETGYTLLQVKSHIQNGKRNLKLMIERMNREEFPLI